MADLTKNPGDRIDLVLLLQSYGESIGTLYPQAIVYDDQDNEISGSPFNLSLVGNNYYSKLGAFQIKDTSATYKILYIVYTDSGHSTKSAEHGEKIDTVTVAIQSTTGLGGFGSMKNNSGGEVIVDFDIVKRMLEQLEKRQNKKIEAINRTIKAGFSIDIKEPTFAPVLKELANIKSIVSKDDPTIIKILNNISSMTKTNKSSNNKLITAIKKNRTTTVKSKFDKALLKPMLTGVAETDRKLMNITNDLKKFIIKTIDMKNEESNEEIQEKLDNAMNLFEKGLNKLNESIRKKLKFTLHGLKTLMFMGKSSKQDINITLKKDE